MRYKNFLFPIFVLLFLFLVLVLTPAVTTQAFQETTKTLKACHVCETVSVGIATPAASLSFRVANYDELSSIDVQISPSVQPVDQIEFEKGVVKGLLFWMENCPHCTSVRILTLPRLMQQFGYKLKIKQVELKTTGEVDILFLVGTKMGLDPNEIGVPFLIIGDKVLIGSNNIDQKASSLIETYLMKGGVGYPDLSELSEFLSGSTTQPREIVVSSATPVPMEPIKIMIYLFWGDGCPHCETAKSFLENLAHDSHQLELKSYEVWYDEHNRELLFQMATAHGFKPRVVPTIFIGERHWEGYNNQFRDEILATINTCIQKGCVDAATKIVPGTGSTPVADVNGVDEQFFGFPFIGTVNRNLGIILAILFLVLLTLLFFRARMIRIRKK